MNFKSSTLLPSLVILSEMSVGAMPADTQGVLQVQLCLSPPSLPLYLTHAWIPCLRMYVQLILRDAGILASSFLIIASASRIQWSKTIFTPPAQKRNSMPFRFDSYREEGVAG